MSVSLPSSKEPAAEYVKTASLKPWKRNPRKNAEAITKVAVSIETFGFGAPILVRKADNRIIAGHTRWEAAKRLGLETVPVRKLDLTEEKANALALADNKLGEIATWDDEQLKSILAELQSHDAALAVVAGWTGSELNAAMESVQSPQVFEPSPGAQSREQESARTDPWQEWEGMPSYSSEKKEPFRTLIVHFDSKEDVAAFEQAIGYSIGDQRGVWFPYREKRDLASKAYVG